MPSPRHRKLLINKRPEDAAPAPPGVTQQTWTIKEGFGHVEGQADLTSVPTWPNNTITLAFGTPDEQTFVESWVSRQVQGTGTGGTIVLAVASVVRAGEPEGQHDVAVTLVSGSFAPVDDQTITFTLV